MRSIEMDRVTAEKVMSLLMDAAALNQDGDLTALFERMEDMGLEPRYDLINGVLEHR